MKLKVITASQTREMTLEAYLWSCQAARHIDSRKLVQRLIEKGVLDLDDLIDLIGMEGQVALEELSEEAA